jgi:serine/threonine protein kinase
MEDSLLQIGSGSYGRVYLDSANKVVIKKVDKFDTNGKNLYHSSTIREILYLANLNHPNLVQLHKITFDKYYIYLHLSYCGYSLLDLYTKENKSKSNSINNSSVNSENLESDYNSEISEISENSESNITLFKFDYNIFKNQTSNYKCDSEFKNRVQNVYNILSSVLETIIYMNYNNIVHNDLKPDNILIYDSKVYLIDLGLSKITVDNYNNTHNNFKAPELFFTNTHNYNSDLYSLALSVYFYIYGVYLEDLICTTESYLLTDSDYKNFYTSIQTHSEFLELFQNSLPFELQKLLNTMTSFDYNKRTNPLQLYFSDCLKPYTKPLKLEKCLKYKISFDDKYLNSKTRLKYVKQKYKFLESLNLTRLFDTSVYIFDLFCSNHKISDSATLELISVGSMILTCSIYDLGLDFPEYNTYLQFHKNTNRIVLFETIDVICFDLLFYTMYNFPNSNIY